MSEDASEILDLVIVGAGIYGICAANTYLTLHPAANIKVLDSDNDVGGIWSRSRLYPQFWSQTPYRLAGFPDTPFKLPDGAETYHDLFESKYLAQYLEDYVDGHEYDGRKLRERFVFRCWVKDVRKDPGDGLWKVRAEMDGKELKYEAKKVIIATGAHSVPYMPDFTGSETFRGRIIHQKDFGVSKIFTTEEPDMKNHTNITVLGGSKSASDIAYGAAIDPHHARKVSWIIRTSGEGPLLLNKPNGFGKYRAVAEVGSTRAIASLSSANPFLPVSWWSWFLHKTVVGDWLLQKIWSTTEIESTALANYDGREGALSGFEGLRSDTSIRWRSGSLGILQRDDFWEVIAKRVQVYRDDIDRLTEDVVVLTDGTEIKTDVLLCGTGWRQEHPYFSTKDAARLGLPISLREGKLAEGETERWNELEVVADREVLKRWPNLANVPKFNRRPVQTTPYRLYNLTVPIADQSIAFLGLQLVPNSYHTALVQTLYAIGALDGTLKLPSKVVMEKEVAFFNRWCARRYPVHGSLGNVLDYEMVSFTDHLLEQLDLSSHRNKGSWWKDLTDPCLASDYAGLVDEYRKKYSAYVR